MKRFLLLAAALSLFATSAFAQCPGGTCPRPTFAPAPVAVYAPAPAYAVPTPVYRYAPAPAYAAPRYAAPTCQGPNCPQPARPFRLFRFFRAR